MKYYLIRKMENKNLNAYGFKNPIRDVNRMTEGEFKEATAGDVIKLEKVDDSLEGVYMGYQESAKFKDSYALKVKTSEGLKVVFVNSIVVDLISSNNLQKGQQIKLVFKGLIENLAKTFKYKDYKLYFK